MSRRRRLLTTQERALLGCCCKRERESESESARARNERRIVGAAFRLLLLRKEKAIAWYGRFGRQTILALPRSPLASSKTRQARRQEGGRRRLRERWLRERRLSRALGAARGGSKVGTQMLIVARLACSLFSLVFPNSINNANKLASIRVYSSNLAERRVSDSIAIRRLRDTKKQQLLLLLGDAQKKQGGGFGFSVVVAGGEKKIKY